MPAIQEVKNQQDFFRLKDVWNHALESSANKSFFLTFEWLYTWWTHFGKGKELAVLVIKEGEEAIGIAPFFLDKERRFGIFSRKILRFIGEGVSDYAGVIAAAGKEEQVFRAVLKWLEDNEREWDRVVLKELRDNDGLLVHLNSSSAALNRQKDIQVCSGLPYLKIEGPWEEYFAAMSSGLKKEIKGLERKLAQHENRECAIDKENADPETLRDMFDLNKDRLKEKGKKGWYERENFYGFIRDVLASLKDGARPSISFMKISGRIAAYAIGFVYGGTLSYWNVAINAEYKQYSPGKMLLFYLIREMHATKRVSEIDLLRGNEEYKYRWATSERKNMMISISR